MFEHVHSVVFEKGVLLARELADANACIDSPCIKQLVPDLWNDDQFLAARECDVAFVEQMIDVRRQEQPLAPSSVPCPLRHATV